MRDDGSGTVAFVRFAKSQSDVGITGVATEMRIEASSLQRVT
jgi:hypothetical protein